MKKSKIPMRKCIGCMESKPQRELRRIAYYEGVLSLDNDGKAKGRGVYLCDNPECINKAEKRRAIERSFAQEVSREQVQAVLKELRNE